MTMLAQRSNARLPSGFPQVIEKLVGSVLELMIHSVEELRAQLDRISLR
jgi:hypothetical protein